MKGTKPGELLQVDHMTVSKNQITGKHFQAWAPVGRYINANIYSSATSKTAKRFLKELIRECPFKIISIQVDGGSEFMRDFEEACAELEIKLFVLPPRRPPYNGGVERGNRIFREEFYARKDLLADSIGDLRAELKKAQHKYNTYRPHHALKEKTPMEYIQNILEAAA
jgi:transposase InsO family protein